MKRISIEDPGESYIKLLSLIDHLHAGVVVHSPDTSIIYANTEASRLLGLSKDQMMGKVAIDPSWCFVREDGSPLPLAEYPISRVISTLQSFENYEIGISKPETDEIVWVLVNAMPEFDQQHELNQVVITFVDITLRKQVEFEMKILSEIVEGMIHTNDLSDLLKLIHNCLKKVVYAENCFFALYDAETDLFNFPYFVDQFDEIPSPQKLHKSCTKFVFRNRKSELIVPQRFKELLEQDQIELVGSASPSWIGVPLQTSEGIIGVMVLQHYSKANVYNSRHLNFLDSIASEVANVIERKRAENELEKSYSLVAATLESTADGILVVDNKSHITNFNRKFAELWMIPAEMAIAKDEKELIAFLLAQLKNPEEFLSKIREVYANDNDIHTDVIEFLDGRTFEVFAQSQIFKNQNMGRVWSFRNVTKQINTLKSLSESEARLHELNATKDKFFSIIAHDLKSPFNAILGFSNILTEQLKKKDYDGIEEYGEIIHQSSQRAVNLLTNLIEWSRSQSGRMVFNPEYVEISSLLNEIYEISNVSAQEKSIRLIKEIPRHFTVLLDKEMISSVIRNLISNSIKFTHSGGEIIVRAEILEGELQISVKDTGVGISSQDIDKLFRIDEAYSAKGTNNETGTGLGLLLCKEFVEKHKGKIWVKSEPDKGSTFYFTIQKY